MRLFPSLEHSRIDALERLRDILSRDLTGRAQVLPGRAASRQVDPSLVVDTLRELTIEDPQAAQNIERLYQASRIATTPTFRKIIDRGIVSRGWGRVTWSWDLVKACEKDGSPLAAAIAAFVTPTTGRRLVLSETAYARLRSFGDWRAREVSVTNGDALEDNIERLCHDTLAPGWVSRELWRASADKPDRLRWWFDRQRLLDAYAAGPDEHWTREDLESLGSSILTTLETSEELRGWRRARAHARQAWAITRGTLAVSKESKVEVPESLDERRSWFERLDHDNGAYRVYEWVISLVWRALYGVRNGAFHGAPNPAIRKLVELAVDRPPVWLALRWQLENNPQHLADLLLCGTSAAFALAQISERRTQDAVAYDREQIEASFARRRENAFQHAAEFGIETLVAEREKHAASFVWLLGKLYEREGFDWQGRSTTTRFERETLWSAIADEATRRPDLVRALLEGALRYTAARLDREGFGSRWADVLGEILRGAEPFTDGRVRHSAALIALRSYHRMLGDDDRFEMSPLSTANASAILRAIGPLRRTLRRTGALKREAKNLGGDYDKTTRLRAKVRTHVRFLAQGIAGAEADAMPDLIGVFEDAVKHALRDDFAAGTVCAFRVDDDVTFGSRRVPLAQDVAAAVARLSPERSIEFAELLARVEEPATLAILTRRLHGAPRKRVERAVAATVASPPSVVSLPQVHARIELLASAELYGEAEELLAKEPSYRTLGDVHGRELWRFRMQLQIDLGLQRYDRVLAASVPDTLKHSEAEDAQRTLDFYRALAEFGRPGGSLERAEELLERLAARRSDVSSYLVDLHAVRVKRLLGPDVSLLPERHGEAQALLATGDEMMGALRDALRANGDATYEGNRTLLRLALGQYRAALDDLDAMPELVLNSDRLWAYRVEALAALGRTAEARASLQRARAAFGDTENMRSAHAALEKREIRLRVEVDTVEHAANRVRAALGELRMLPIALQARAVELDELHRFVVNHVRRACAEMMELVVFVKEGKTGPLEESINALLRNNLALRTAHLGWAWHGESPGGWTQGSKWGSRDLVLEKDATPFTAIEPLRVLALNDSSLDEVRAHYVKLFGYAPTCELLFLIAWSFVDHVDVLEEKMKELAKSHCPTGFPMIGDVRPLRNRQGTIGPLGFRTLHKGPAGEIHVVHLVVDLKQHAQRMAASDARAAPP